MFYFWLDTFQIPRNCLFSVAFVFCLHLSSFLSFLERGLRRFFSFVSGWLHFLFIFEGFFHLRPHIKGHNNRWINLLLPFLLLFWRFLIPFSFFNFLAGKLFLLMFLNWLLRWIEILNFNRLWDLLTFSDLLSLSFVELHNICLLFLVFLVMLGIYLGFNHVVVLGRVFKKNWLFVMHVLWNLWRLLEEVYFL